MYKESNGIFQQLNLCLQNEGYTQRCKPTMCSAVSFSMLEYIYIGITVFVCLCVWILSGQYLWNCSTFFNQTWYGDASSWARVSCGKIGLLTSRSRSQWGFILSKYDCFCCIFWTADPFAIKLSFMVHRYKWDVLWENWLAVLEAICTVNVQNVIEYLWSQYFRNNLIFCYQTWCGDASSWARVSCRKTGVLTSRTKSQWGLV